MSVKPQSAEVAMSMFVATTPSIVTEWAQRENDFPLPPRGEVRARTRVAAARMGARRYLPRSPFVAPPEG